MPRVVVEPAGVSPPPAGLPGETEKYLGNYRMNWLRRMLMKFFPRSRAAQNAAKEEKLNVRLMAVGMSNANQKYPKSRKR